jgi:hypothetical protein
MYEVFNKSCNSLACRGFLHLIVASKSLYSLWGKVATPHLHGATSLRKLLVDYPLWVRETEILEKE